VNGATFTGNTTTGDGGAIFDDADIGGAIVTNSTFYGNTAAGYGGAVEDAAQEPGMFAHDVVYDNRAGGSGGGIASSSAIENSEIFGNHASTGGGLYVYGQSTVTVTGTSIWGNSAGDGGGIYAAGLANSFSLQAADDTITGNHASADGGGIYNLATAFPAAELNLAHTNISGNNAGSLGGGIYSAGAVAAAYTTISLNTAHGGGGIYQTTEDNGNGVVLTSSAVLDNTPDNCEPPGVIATQAGTARGPLRSPGR
jgi:Chlamydia polymorphic membrane protein (Chlamydia_PMP) repeat